MMPYINANPLRRGKVLTSVPSPATMPSKLPVPRFNPLGTIVLFVVLFLVLRHFDRYSSSVLSSLEPGSGIQPLSERRSYYSRAQHPAPSCAKGRAKSFLIVFLSRSGSTAICSELRKHPDVHMEILELLDKTNVPPSNVSLALSTTREFFQRGIAMGKIPGFKIRAKHILSDPAAWVELMNEFDTRVIWQYRRNIVKTVIGTYLLERYGDSTAISGIKKSDMKEDRCSMGVGCKFKVDDLGLFHRLLKERIRGEGRVTEAARAIGRDCLLEVPYEDYLHGSAATIERLQSFLGIERQLSHSDRLKATGDNLCELIENFDEFCEAFYGCSIWQPFLEDNVNDCRCTRVQRIRTEYCGVV